MTTTPRNPASTTFTEVVDHVKTHLTPDVSLDHLTDYDVRAIVGLALHSIGHFGLTVVPISSGGLPTPAPLEVGRIEASVPVALKLVALATWRSIVRRLIGVCDWLDARLEGSP